MKNVDYRPVYYCDFRASDGALLLSYQQIRFEGQPSWLVNFDAGAFKKIWQAGDRVVYVQVSSSDISCQVSING